VRVPVLPKALADTVSDIQRRLRDRGVVSGAIDEDRVGDLETAATKVPKPWRLWTVVVRIWRILSESTPQQIAIAAGAAVLLVVIGYQFLGSRKVWITAPSGDHVEDTYDGVRWNIDEMLTLMNIQIANERNIKSEMRRLGCGPQGTGLPECDDRKIMESLGIETKADPNYRSAGTAWSLGLRIGDGQFDRCVPPPPNDSNTFSLAIWGAEKIAECMGLYSWTINRALGGLRERNAELESLTTGGLESRNFEWPALFTTAFAADCPASNDQDVGSLLASLKAALQSMEPGCVAALFVSMTPGQRDGLEQYFNNVSSLSIEFDEPDIHMRDDSAAQATFVRRDEFTDRSTNKTIRLAIRLVAEMSRTDAHWKIQTLRKAS
jgi:hypothetical protein